MRRPFVPAPPEEAEAHAEDLAYGAGARAWDMDSQRHNPESLGECRFDTPAETGTGKYAWSATCLTHRITFYSASPTPLRWKLEDHEKAANR